MQNEKLEEKLTKRVFTQTLAVVGAIIEKDGKFLLVKEAMGDADRGKWNHPAGWLDVGENPIEGVKREVKEETGSDFTPTGILGLYSLVRNDLDPTLHPIKVIFVGKISDEGKAELAEDVSETRWFTQEEILKMDSHTLRDSDIKQMTKDHFSGNKFPLTLLTHSKSN